MNILDCHRFANIHLKQHKLKKILKKLLFYFYKILNAYSRKKNKKLLIKPRFQ